MTTEHRQEPMTCTLAELRRATGLSQSAVAERMGVNQPRVSQIEKDFPNLHYAVVANYLRALEATPSVLVQGRRVNLEDIQADPRSTGAQTNRRSRSADGIAQMQSAAEELPLKQRDTEPGCDNTGWGVDQPDTEGNQGDREDGKDT